jgi:hypothetical protein
MNDFEGFASFDDLLEALARKPYESTRTRAKLKRTRKPAAHGPAFSKACRRGWRAKRSRENLLQIAFRGPVTAQTANAIDRMNNPARASEPTLIDRMLAGMHPDVRYSERELCAVIGRTPRTIGALITRACKRKLVDRRTLKYPKRGEGARILSTARYRITPSGLARALEVRILLKASARLKAPLGASARQSATHDGALVP